VATSYSQTTFREKDRRDQRRQSTIEEALDHAVDVMSEQGVGGLTISEVARRMGLRAPSLYKYFPSLHAVYDALFARGVVASGMAVQSAVAGLSPGQERLRRGTTAVVRWSVEHPALAQLLFWRPVPGFAPSAAAFAGSVDQMGQLRAELAAAVRTGELHPEADSDDAIRILTVLMSGLISQQLANQPGVPFEDGRFTTLTQEALDLFFTRYAARST